MKTEILFIKGLNREITFYIGQTQSENFDIIDMCSETDLWFHANDISSCHVVAILPDDINKKDLKYIIKRGALLCKMNTNKLKSIRNLQIIYTQIKNIIKTKISGCVKVNNGKILEI